MTGRVDITLEAARWVLIEAPRLQRLRIGCSYVAETGRDEWVTLVVDPRRHQLVSFELSLGRERSRHEYNAACLDEVRKTRRAHVGHLGGFGDYFVPVLHRSRLLGILACGPFLTERPTAALLRQKWQSLRGAPADPTDEAFLRFVRAHLESHVYAGPTLTALGACLARFAAGMTGAHVRTESGWDVLETAIPETRMWELAAQFTDRERIPVWTASFKGTDRLLARIFHMPNRVLSIAPSNRPDEDMVDRLLRADALQRAAAALAVTMPDTLAGRMGDEAAFLVTYVPDKRAHTLGERVVQKLGKRLGWNVVCGISQPALRGAELPIRYGEANRAIVAGLRKNERVTMSTATEPASPAALYRSSRALCESFAGGRARELGPEAEQVVSDVVWVSGGSIEAMRSHLLQVVWELAAITDRRNVIDKRTSSEMMKLASARLARASTTAEIGTAFTEIVGQWTGVLSQPHAVAKRAKVEEARRIVEHAAPLDDLRVEAIGKRVGLSAHYLSHRFKQTYGVELGRFVVECRTERAKRLLRDTALRAVEIAAEAGFSSPSYFHQAFRRVTGRTPEQYRRASRVMHRDAT
jgi:AraC-like DNA-binding protein